MCAFAKGRHAEAANHGATSDLNFEITNGDLRDLMKLRGDDAIEYMKSKYGNVNGLASLLHVNLISGLNNDNNEIKQRQIAFGKNEIPPKPPKLFIQLVFDALKDTTLIILIVCACISIALSQYHPPEDASNEEFTAYREQNLEWIEGAAIFVAVIVVVFVTAFNDWQKERQFRGLQDRIEKDNITTVVRSDEVIQINIKDLVVGDICCIKYGDLLPADGVVIQSNDLKIDESSLTGETDLIKKNDERNFILLAGTHVMEGSGKYLVTAVGLNSQTGIIFQLLGATKTEKKSKAEKKKDRNAIYKNISTKDEDEPNLPKVKHESNEKLSTKSQSRSVLQTKLNKLAIQIGYVGMCSALITFILLCARMAIDEFLIKKQAWSNTYIKYIISFLIQGVTVIVVAVPEGLPLAVTLSLAYAVRQMTADNNLVRHLDACETMGNATTICSDKTGTLTTNRMTVVQGYFGKQLLKRITSKDVSDKIKEIIFQSIAINTNYTSKLEVPKQVGELAKQLGNKTECALLGLVIQLGGNYEEIRAANPIENFSKIYTFNSARKMMSSVIKHPNNIGYRLYTKGASEIILEKCSYILNSDGEVERMSDSRKKGLIKFVVEVMAMDGLRTICVAYKDLLPKKEIESGIKKENAVYYDDVPNWDNESEIVSDLTCICIVGIEDPVREEVSDAIRKCQRGGVVVRMVTGDNINTATSIALKCGILRPGDDFLVLDSKDFNGRIRDPNTNQVSQKLLDQVWPKLRVLARSSPQDKYVLVNGIVESKLSSNREVVAVTGDGTNDGPALKRADVGFAMGIQGTDVAKEASDIILTDDNFNSIVKAMMWGRNVYDSIAKFLQFQLTANLVAALLSIFCAATIKAVPLKAVQMLWVNLVMDTLASLALGTERPTEELLERKPYGRTKPIISIRMTKNIVLHGVYQLAVIIALVFYAQEWFLIDSVIKYNDINKLRAPSQHFTFIFNAFVLMTLFNEINARKIHGERNVFKGIHRNPYFYVIWIICFIGQVLIVNFGDIAFSVVRLDIDHWMWCFFFGIGSLIWGQIVILVPTKIFKRLLIRKKAEEAKVPEIPEEEVEMDVFESLNKSKILWLRGVTRIQQQLKVVAAFRTRLEELRDPYGSVSSLRDVKV